MCVPVGLGAGAGAKLSDRFGIRAVAVTGSIVGAPGVLYLPRLPLGGGYSRDLFPGFVVTALGMGAVFVSVRTVATGTVRAEHSGLASALLGTAQQVGGAVGLAVLSSVAAAQSSAIANGVSLPCGPRPRISLRPRVQRRSPSRRRGHCLAHADAARDALGLRRPR